MFNPSLLAGDGPATHSPSPYAQIKLVAHRINDHLHMIEATELTPGRLVGNILVSVGDEGVLMVDDQYLELTDRIKQTVATLSDEPVKFVINSHAHADHSSGNPAFGGPEGAVIIAHKHVREFLTTSHDVNALGRRYELPAMDPAGWPKITLEDEIELHHNGDTIRIIHLGRGHTNGDVLVHFVESNVIHMGDAYVRYGLPWIDLYNNGSAEGLIKALDIAASVADEETIIVPGHGAMSDLKSMVETRDALDVIISRVKAGIAASMSLEEIQATKPTRDFGDPGILGAEPFVEIVFRSLHLEASR